MINLTKAHFETEENHQKYLSEWRETTLLRTISENPDKSRLECFQLTVDKLQKVQRGLTKEYQYEHNLRDQVINACRGVEECNLALYKPSPTFEGICAELRSAIGTAMRSREAKSTFTTQLDVDDKYEIGLTAHTEAADEAGDEASVHTEGGEEAQVNIMEETREQGFSRRDVMSATNQAAGPLSILSRREGRHTRSSVNILHIHWRKRPPQNITTASSPNMKELKKLTILRPNLIPSSSCQ